MGTASPSTDIAELLPTFAAHGTATGTSLDPIIAFWTLFEFGSFDEIQELLVVFVEAIVDPVLSTGHPGVILASASQTVVFFASRASVVVESLVKLKNGSAASSWTPGDISSVHLNKLIKRELLVFIAEVSVDIV